MYLLINNLNIKMCIMVYICIYIDNFILCFFCKLFRFFFNLLIEKNMSKDFKEFFVIFLEYMMFII